jgi:CspA family cold shock protein
VNSSRAPDGDPTLTIEFLLIAGRHTPCVAGDILDSVWCAGIIEIPKWRQQAMATGVVKWFNPTKGYGFIQPQGGGKDVFVHISAVERAGLSTLNEGQQVQYEEVANKGKTSAENLKVK